LEFQALKTPFDAFHFLASTNSALNRIDEQAHEVYAVYTMAEFIDDEILEMAVAREVDANRFYLALGARVGNPRIKKIFEKLAAEELGHKSKLELEIMKTGKVVKQKHTTAGFRSERPDYVPPVIEMSYKDILLMGIQKEDASLQLYTDLAEMTSDDHSKEIFLAMAQEEAAHKQRFQKIFEFLSHIA
jgi:rubrerythrin